MVYIVIDYTEDVSMIISDWDTLIKIKSLSATFDDAGRRTETWTTITTANVDVQPISVQKQIRMEELGHKKVSTHICYGYTASGGAKMIIEPGNRIYDGTTIYEVIAVNDYSGSHLEIYARKVDGKA